MESKEVLKAKFTTKEQEVNALISAATHAREAYDAINDLLKKAIDEKAEIIEKMLQAE